MNFVAGGLILGTILEGGWEYILWGLTILIFAVTPALVPEEAGGSGRRTSSSGTAWS